jgi:hypothetical protein
MEISFNPNFLIGGVLCLTIFAVLVWLGWRRRAWMPKTATIAVRGIVGLVGVLVVLGTIWFTWEFRPWMPPGGKVHLISERIGDYEFEVWQRKTNIVSEPFATGLFVRKHGDKHWRAYLLDFEDDYRPSIAFRKEEFHLAVLHDGEEWGYFNEGNLQLYRRRPSGDFPVEYALFNKPPDDCGCIEWASFYPRLSA